MGQLTIRGADEADLAGLVRVRIDSWRAAYAGLVPPAYLDELDPEASLVRTRNQLRSRPEGWHFLVAERDAALVGFVIAGPERPAAEVVRGDRPRGGEVHALYTHPDAWFTGAGAALLDAAVTALRADGHAPLLLWVLEQNTQARRFYERQGWRPDGGRTALRLGGALLQELRYVRAPVSALPRPRARTAAAV
ncbi:GNAT family N-acetyltransferase [Streptacidiphilus rugosus]|uniref:GNAT family N-acetyltransferase n=1 Tax=Streptacidiphilus rugosus TaxID=405783 RepID=UPI000565B553|nr:GNAT family N-acetyltransferase [Streptacidiphilus rugosus]